MLRRWLKRKLGRSLRSQPSPTPQAAPAAPPPEPALSEPEEAIDLEVDDASLVEWLRADPRPVLLDIREAHEIRFGHAEGALLIRMNEIPERLEELPAKDTRLLVYCAAGVRSFGVVGWLREQGWEDSWSVSGGFSAVLASGVDSVTPEP